TFRSWSDLDGPPSDATIEPLTVRRLNPYISYPAVSPTPGVPGNFTPVVHGDYRLVGGPEIFGYLSAGTSRTIADTNNGLYYWLQTFPSRPQNAVGLVQRINTITVNTPNPQVRFINFGISSGLTDPPLAINRTVDATMVTLQPLQLRAGIVSSLPRFNTWLTYILPGDSTITARFTPYSTPVTVSTTTSGSTPLVQNLWLLDTG